ncbi:hypothetical protein [Aquimarina algiphila]|uniref:hypothetical protein n=1 Tax=Aquimarina algiphila TaxID=2047982 RepID=UPI00249218EE|nr:hypothetical protein [Aquimarina algiphila]
MKKSIYLPLLFLTLTILIGCNTDDNTLTEPDTTNIEPETDDEDEFKNDVFVNGINQTYLQETGMTEEELLTSIEEDDMKNAVEFEKQLNDQFQNMTAIDPNNKATQYNQRELAGAITNMLNDIKQEPGKYFQAKIGVNSDRSPFFDLGLSDKLIRQTIASFPEFKIYSKRQKINLYRFSLRRIKVSGSSRIKIEIRCKIRYRRYVKFFGKRRRIINKRLSADLHIPLNFDAKTNTLKVNTLKVDRIHITSFIFNPIIAVLNQIVKRFVIIREDVNLNISYDFISKAYVDYKGLYKERLNGQNFIFFKFDVKTDDLIDTIKGKLKTRDIKF